MGIEKQHRDAQGWRSSIVAAASLAFFGMSVAAYADTYNFYFSKGKKKKAPVESTVESDAESTQDVVTDEDTADEPAEPKNSVGRSNQPIIINNNIHGVPTDENRRFTPPESSSYRPEFDPEDRPPAKPIGARSDSSPSTTVATTLKDPDDFSHFRFGLSAIRWSSRGNGADFDGSGDPGLVTTLGIDFTRALGMNIYGGRYEYEWQFAGGNGFRDSRFLLGAEFQFTPFRLNVGSFDLFELGFIAGTSTLGRTGIATLIDPEQIHLGARFSINFGKSFGITTVGRANGRYAMAEVGLTARL